MPIVPGTDARRTVVNEPLEEALANFLSDYHDSITDEDRTQCLEKFLMDSQEIFDNTRNILQERKVS